MFQIWRRSVQGFSVGCGSNFAIPHDFDGRPYNTLTLPCERHGFLKIFLEIRGERVMFTVSFVDLPVSSRDYSTTRYAVDQIFALMSSLRKH